MRAVGGGGQCQRVSSHRRVGHIEHVGRTRVEVNKALLHPVHVVLTAGRRDRDHGRRVRAGDTAHRVTHHRVEIVELGQRAIEIVKDDRIVIEIKRNPVNVRRPTVVGPVRCRGELEIRLHHT